MFEDDIDGNGIPCDHPLRWYHRLADWVHRVVESLPVQDRFLWHDRLSDWVCEAWERITCSYPCHQCAADREREYGAVYPDDEAIKARMRDRAALLGLANPFDDPP